MRKEIDLNNLNEFLFGEGSEERREEFFDEVERIAAFSLVDETPIISTQEVPFQERKEKENPFEPLSEEEWP